MQENLKLTQSVQKGGCAAKVAASELRQILAQVKFPKVSDDVIVDGHLMDDAAVVKISPELALVQTLDFFTPILDSPYLFGQVAAVNALSDVYAMGGVPKTALAILAFPLATMSQQTIAQVMQGASDKIGEAGASLVGGHSIDDDTLKFGLSVTGYVHPEKIWKNSGAESGDKLILTKALGTGTATAALKRQEVIESDIQDEINSMCQLNSLLDFLNADQLSSIHAATDITGFGFAGHSVQMARASKKTFKVDFAAVPRFTNTLSFMERGFLTKAHRTNREYVISEIQTSLSDLQMNLLFDPQTSGGLLLSVKAAAAEAVCVSLGKKNRYAAIVGSVEEPLEATRLIVK